MSKICETKCEGCQCKEWHYKGSDEIWKSLYTAEMWHSGVAEVVAKDQFKKGSTSIDSFRLSLMIKDCMGYVRTVNMKPDQSINWVVDVDEQSE